MGSERFDDEIWDEFRWEQHINAIERKSVQLKDFITATWGESSPSWVRLLGEYKNQNDVIDAFIEEELMFEEAYFPEDDDWDDDDDDDPDNDLFMSDEEDDDFFNQLLSDFDDDEDDDDDDDDDAPLSSFRIEDIEFLDDMLPYSLARTFGIKVLGIAQANKEIKDDAIFNQFIQTSLQISAKLAAGFSFGFDTDVMGGNITYCKKALENANRALDLLHMLKSRSWMKAAEYYELDEQLFDVRNEIGMYIQDLRETFRNTLF
jgi:hypothetical protein